MSVLNVGRLRRLAEKNAAKIQQKPRLISEE